MFSFTKPLENLIGAAYLSGALEGLNKYRTLNPSELQSYEDDAKHVRRVLLNRAESDGYKQPVHHIEDAKKIAKNVLNSRGKNNKSLNSLSVESTPKSPTTVEPILKEEHMESPTTLSNLKTEEHKLESNVSHVEDEVKNIEDHELQPLPKTPNSSKPVNKPSTPPPVLQLGGRKKRATRRKARKSKKSRKQSK